VLRVDMTRGVSCKIIRVTLDIGIDQGPGYDGGGATVAWIDTPPDFGCVLWEPIADEPTKETT